jgi:hypothetical protein
MPHYKCVACKTRLYSAGHPPELVGDLCPECGSLLEPVGELTEVVGFRSIRSRDGAADDEAPGTHQQIAARVDDFLARRAEILAQARLDAERWVDEGGSFRAEAVAVAMPRPETNS